MIGDHLDAYTLQKLQADALALVSDNIDKRQGSVIWDTLSVFGVQLAEAYIRLKGFYLDTYALTATGEYLDLRAEERGITRQAATCAVKRALFLNTAGDGACVPLGTVLSTVSDTSPLLYTVTDDYTENGVAVPGFYQLTCQTAGTGGNDYVGDLQLVTYQGGIAAATMDTLLVPARDVESDDSLRARYLALINNPPYGGNIAHYRQWISAMDGVGSVQVYPSWAGGGTVKCSIIGADFLPASDTLVQAVQTAMDPEENHGEGLGIAPIGHTVTICTPEALPIHTDADVNLAAGVTAGQVLPAAAAAISAYLLALRKGFGTASGANQYVASVYRGRITAAIQSVDGVENVTHVLINGNDADLVLAQNKLVQQLPTDGTVTLHAI